MADDDSLERCYNAKDKEHFMQYFIPKKAQKKKRGRPKKRKSNNTKPKKNTSKTKKQQDARASQTLLLNASQTLLNVNAKLEGVARQERRVVTTRVNWDLPGNKEERERMTTSWLNKNDLYRKGDSFRRFCVRCGIHESVLRRYLKRLRNEEPPKKRGRKTLLPESVMRHICEGVYCCLYAYCLLCDFVCIYHCFFLLFTL